MCRMPPRPPSRRASYVCEMTSAHPGKNPGTKSNKGQGGSECKPATVPRPSRRHYSNPMLALLVFRAHRALSAFPEPAEVP